MRVLIFSDLHLHNWKYGSRILSGYNSRLLGQQSVLQHIRRYCKENNIDRIVFCGDLFHTHGRIETEVLEVAVKEFSALSRIAECFMLVGNHDMKSKDGAINACNIFTDLGWSVVTPRQYYTASDMAFFSYTDDLETFQFFMDRLDKKYVFMHQGVQSVPVGSGFEIPNEFLKPDNIPKCVKFLFTGHYHRHQKVSTKLIVIGSPMQHTWSDSGDKKGWVVLDTDKESWKFVSSEFGVTPPEFVELAENKKTTSALVAGNFIRILGDVDEKKRAALMQLAAQSVEFKAVSNSKKTSRLSIGNVEKFSFDKIISQFEKDNNLDKETIAVGRDLRAKTYETH